MKILKSLKTKNVFKYTYETTVIFVEFYVAFISRLAQSYLCKTFGKKDSG